MANATVGEAPATPPPPPGRESWRWYDRAGRSVTDLLNNVGKRLVEADRALTFSFVLGLFFTFPALYISLSAVNFLLQAPTGDALTNAHAFTKLMFGFSGIQGELYETFTLVALPTITAFAGAAEIGSSRKILTFWVFLFFLVLFFLSFGVTLAEAGCEIEKAPDPEILNRCAWWQPISSWSDALNENPKSVGEYVKNIRDSALGAIAVMAGIKLGERVSGPGS